MIKTNCENVVGIYTHCESVIAVYTYCDLVWEQGPVPPGEWYVSWTPTYISGDFYMFGEQYQAADYNGFYSWSGPASTSGRVTSRAFFQVDDMVTMETNVKSVEFEGFTGISNLTYANLYRCTDLDTQAFANNFNLSQVNLPRLRRMGSYAFERCSVLETISLPRCSQISSGAFESCYTLSYAYLPVLEEVSFATFRYCSSLTSVYLPVCSNIGQMAFAYAGLTSIDLPVCTSIAVSAFIGNTNLSQVSLPVCEFVGANAFDNCTSLEELSLPACINFNGANNLSVLSRVDMPLATNVRLTNCPSLVDDISIPSAQAVMFYNCSNLTSISLPECTTLLGDYGTNQVPSKGAFEGCTHLRSIELPKLTSMYYNAFKSCTLLSYADLGSVGSIPTGAFYDCPNLSIIVLKGSSVATLMPDIPNFFSSYIDSIFHNTPIANCQGAVYVPIYLYREYLSNERWSYISCNIKSMIPEPGSYYVSWHPTTISGSFKLNSHTQYYEDYTDGVYAWFDGVIDSNAFVNGEFTEFETNAYSINDGAFENCESMTTIFLHSCTYLGKYVFDGCNYLSRFSAPYCEYVGNECFTRCSRLSSINLPACSYIGNSAFRSCGNLSIIELPVCEEIGYSVFYQTGSYWNNAPTIVLGSTSVVTLNGPLYYSSRFYGSIYVPSSLVDAYKSANNWSIYSSKIYPIPEP